MWGEKKSCRFNLPGRGWFYRGKNWVARKNAVRERGKNKITMKKQKEERK